MAYLRAGQLLRAWRTARARWFRCDRAPAPPPRPQYTVVCWCGWASQPQSFGATMRTYHRHRHADGSNVMPVTLQPTHEEGSIL